MATNKLTNKKALEIAIHTITNADLEELWSGNEPFSIDEVIAKLESMVAALDSKAANTKKKFTKTQLENVSLRAAIMDFLRERPNLVVSCTDLGKRVPALDGLNNQKISALMRGLVDAGDVVKYTEKGKTTFQFAAKDDGEEEDSGE